MVHGNTIIGVLTTFPESPSKSSIFVDVYKSITELNRLLESKMFINRHNLPRRKAKYDNIINRHRRAPQNISSTAAKKLSKCSFVDPFKYFPKCRAEICFYFCFYFCSYLFLFIQYGMYKDHFFSTLIKSLEILQYFIRTLLPKYNIKLNSRYCKVKSQYF